MTEKRLLSFIITEGVLAVILGLCLLILPKMTMLTFGFILSITFIIYGGYRIISSVLTRNYSMYFMLNFFAGVILLLSGGILFFAPVVDVMLISSALGVYFILTSLSVSAFGIRGSGIIEGQKLLFILSSFEIIWSLIVITTLSSSALWLAGIIAGFDFIFSGIAFINVYFLTNNKAI